jgi:hypothetical protein
VFGGGVLEEVVAAGQAAELAFEELDELLELESPEPEPEPEPDDEELSDFAESPEDFFSGLFDSEDELPDLRLSVL